MAGVARIPRSRGGVTGVLLILLGAWGGLAPFVGPYFHYAYTPDKAWAYTSGRLWLSIVPGAAALAGGLLVLATAHRAVGCFGAVLAVLGGVWFVVGIAVIPLAVTNGSVSPGAPLVRTVGSLSPATYKLLEQLGFFTGVGVLILLCAALALGRFSVVGVREASLAEERDAALAEEPSASSGEGYPVPDPVTQDVTFPAPSSTGQFGAVGSREQSPTAPEQFPTTTSPLRRPPDTGGLSGPS
jgi:hypothetical protein